MNKKSERQLPKHYAIPEVTPTELTLASNSTHQVLKPEETQIRYANQPIPAPSTASIFQSESNRGGDQRTEKMNPILSQMDHQSLTSGNSISKSVLLSNYGQSNAQQHHSASVPFRDPLHIKAASGSVISQSKDQIRPLEHYLHEEIPPLMQQSSTDIRETEPDPLGHSLLLASQQVSQLSSARLDSNPSHPLQVQSQKVSIASKLTPAVSIQKAQQSHHQTASLSSRNQAATPILMTTTTDSAAALETQSRLNTIETSSKSAIKSTHKSTTTHQVAQLEQKVSALVLKMEQMRPLTREAKRLLESKASLPQALSSRPSRSGNRSSSKDSSQTRVRAWVPSTNSHTVSLQAISAAKRVGNQTQRSNQQRRSSLPRSITPNERCEKPMQTQIKGVTAEEKAYFQKIKAQVNETLEANGKQVELAAQVQQELIQQRVEAQQQAIKGMAQRVIDLQACLEAKQKAKEQRKLERKRQRKSQALTKLKEEILSQLVDELRPVAQKEEEPESLLDPATRAYLDKQLASQQSSEACETQEDQDERKESDKLVVVDLEKNNHSVQSQVNHQARQASKTSESSIEMVVIDPCSTNERAIEGTVITASEPDDESQTHTQIKDRSHNLPRPAPTSEQHVSSHSSQLVPQLTDTLEQIKLAIGKLEAFSLSSSEDINEGIEQLVTCFNSNTAALQRALDDLKTQRSALRGSDEGTSDSVYDTANKILSQFENFAEYTRSEVAQIEQLLNERDSECQQSLRLLSDELIPQQSRFLEGRRASQSEHVQFEACKEHVEALRLHISNTQQFLMREAGQVEAKLSELQVSVVKDVQTIFAQTGSAERREGGGGRMSIISSVSPSSSSFLEQSNQGLRNRSLFLRHSDPQSQEKVGLESTLEHGNDRVLTEAKPTPSGREQLTTDQVLLSSFSPSRGERSSLTKDEMGALFSPQEQAVGGGVVLRSQISTIPEEEIDTDFGQTEVQSTQQSFYAGSKKATTACLL